MNYEDDNAKRTYMDEDLRSVDVVMEKGSMKLYVPPEYLLILMRKESDIEIKCDVGFCRVSCWDELRLMMDEYIGETFENCKDEILDRVIYYLNHIYLDHKSEIEVMKAIKDNL